MSFSTYEDLCAMWAYLEELDPSLDFRAKCPFISKLKLARALDALQQWRPDVSVHHHAIAVAALAHFRNWHKRHQMDSDVIHRVVVFALHILRSDWNPLEHGIEGRALKREAFFTVRDYGRLVLAEEERTKSAINSLTEYLTKKTKRRKPRP